MSADVIGAENLREVRLYGHLGKRFGRIHMLAVRSAREAVLALGAILPGFSKHVLDHNKPGYHVFTRRVSVATNRGADLLDAPVGRGEAIIIVPAVAGAKKAGVLQTIVGVVLIVAGYYFGQTWMVQLGVSMVIGGVVQMMTPVRSAKEDPADSRLASYAFDGPVNSTQQGLPVQVIFGEMFVGSSVISQGISSTDIATA